MLFVEVVMAWDSGMIDVLDLVTKVLLKFGFSVSSNSHRSERIMKLGKGNSNSAKTQSPFPIPT